jgi:hypothetical protein
MRLTRSATVLLAATLLVALQAAPAAAAPTVDVTVDPVGRVDPQTGVAFLTGTYTCSSDGLYIAITGEVRQAVGRFVVFGGFDFFEAGACDGTSHPWSATVLPANGRFAGGKAMTLVTASSCDPFECTTIFPEQTVRLRGGK